MGWVTDWSAQAACRTTDPDELFVQGAAQNRAKAVCTGCPVRTECLADALDNRVEFGVWGGMTERERRALLRRRPTVTSWRRLLETARSEYERAAGLLPDDADLDIDLDAGIDVMRGIAAVDSGLERADGGVRYAAVG
ncbi:WhiB family transcriptional regulator [Streptomyces tsukubensis]|nr:WhiB family transcriptional regulator [Streptomyces tsukubensis]